MLKLFKKNQPISEPKKPSIKEELVAYPSLIYNDKDFTRYNPSDLIIKRGSTIYSKMMKDEQVKACLEIKKSSVLSRGYTFSVDKGNEQQERIADFFWFMINNMKGSFNDKLNGILSGIHNGFSISEKVYNTMEWDGSTYWTVGDIKLKPFDTFTFQVDGFGNIKGVQQNVGYNDKTVPMNRIIHWVYRPNVDECYGESDLRSCFRAWWAKDTVVKFYNIFMERHASGFPIIKPVEGAPRDPTIKTKFLDILSNLSVRTNLFLPRGYDAEMIQPQRTDAYEKAIALYDKAIAKSFLIPNLLGLSEQGSTGSYSQSQTQLVVFLDLVIESLCNNLAECLNEQLFRELALINFGASDYPKFQFVPMTKEGKIELVKIWSELVSKSTVISTEKDEIFVRELLGFPEKDEKPDDELEPSPEPGPEGIGEPEGTPEEPDVQMTYAENPWIKRVDFAQIKKTFDENEQQYLEDFTNLMASAKFSIQKQIKAIAKDRSFGHINPKEFDNIMIPKTVATQVRKLTRTTLQGIADSSYTEAVKEIPKKSYIDFMAVGMNYKTSIERFLASKSMKVTSIVQENILRSVGQVLENGIKYDKSLKDIMLELDTNTDVILYLPEKIDPVTGEWIKVNRAGRKISVPARLENIARTNIADAVNQSRLALFNSPEVSGFVQAFEYSAILDERVTDICERLHGRIKRDWGSYVPPNHYQCFDKETEVLTTDGFIPFSEITGEETFFTIDPKTHIIDTSQAYNKIAYVHQGKLLHFKHYSFDMMITPEHDIAYIPKWNSDNSIKLRQAKTLAVSDRIPRVGIWKGNNRSTIKIGDYTYPLNLFMEFMGYYLSDGSITLKSKNHWSLKISKSKRDKTNIAKCAKYLFGNNYNVHVNWKDGIYITGNDQQFYTYFRSLGYSHQKYIPEDLKQLDSEYLRIFLNAFCSCDGYTYDVKKNNAKKGDKWTYNFKDMNVYFSSSKQLIEDIGEIIFKVGKLPSYYAQGEKKEFHQFNNGVYPINHPCYKVVECNTNNYSHKKKYVKEVDYNDMVYCVTLEKHNILYVRRNGKCTWSGNCRSILVPVTVIDEWSGKEHSIPSKLEPHKGFS